MEVNQQSVLLGEPREVDLVEIERGLSHLWKQASESGDAEASFPVMRACSLNLIVVAGTESYANLLADLVGDVTVEHPGRIFIVSADGLSEQSSLSAWISARCSLPVPGGKQVCCEQITLAALGSSVNSIPSAITSLLVADVPAVLLWYAPIDTDDNVLDSLTKISDRVIMDSSGYLESAPALVSWHRLRVKRGGRPGFGDLAWTRLTPWRSVISQAFDPVDMRRHLTSLVDVTVEYSVLESQNRSGLSQGLLLAGWMASRLKWSPVHGFQRTAVGSYRARFEAEGRRGNVSIVPSLESRARRGDIESVGLRSSSGMQLMFWMTHQRGSVHSSKSPPGLAAEQNTVFVREYTHEELLAREMEELHRDPLYEDSLAALAGLLSWAA